MNKSIEKLIVDARKEFIKLRNRQDNTIQEFYDILAEQLKSYIGNSKNQITKKQYENILEELDVFISELRINLNDEIKNNIQESIVLASTVSIATMQYIINQASINIPSIKDFKKLVDNKNSETYDYISKRTYGVRKLTLSNRIWKSSIIARRSIKNVLQHGIDNNMSARDIAKDLEKYLKSNLTTSNKLRRNIKVPKRPSFYSMRVARTEVMSSFQQSTYNIGALTPGYLGITWLLSSQHPLYDICDKLANSKKHGKKGFYPKGYEPSIPHPQCICVQIQEYEDFDVLINRFKLWEKNPKRVPNLQKWYKSNFE